MISKKLIAAVALLSMSAGALADGTYEFASITKLRFDSTSVTGVLVNDTVPTTLTLTSINCFSWLELMMKSPGAYNLTVTVTTVTYPQAGAPPGSATTLHSCILEVKP